MSDLIEGIEQLREKYNKLSDELYIKQQELEKKRKEEIKVSKNILSIVDQLDVINRYATEVKDKNLKNILEITYKQVSS